MQDWNIDMTLEVNSTSYEDTLQLAAKIGRELKGGETIELVSDVGGGKTAFVTGLAQGAGSLDVVSSPSFTINQVYSAGDKVINHYDFYRLQDPGIMSIELAEAISDPESVVVVEWADTVEEIMPADRLVIAISAPSENGRKLIFNAPDNLSYLLKAIA